MLLKASAQKAFVFLQGSLKVTVCQRCWLLGDVYLVLLLRTMLFIVRGLLLPAIVLERLGFLHLIS